MYLCTVNKTIHRMNKEGIGRKTGRGKQKAMYLWLLLSIALSAAGQGQPLPPDKNRMKQCPLVKIQPERLPDMHIARSGHASFFANGELVVVGGHTEGFVPTATAEYLSGGKWHEMQSTYPHDDGLYAQMKSGNVLIAGGHSEPLGVGATFTAEIYDPATHTFSGYGCLDRRRALSWRCCGASIN